MTFYVTNQNTVFASLLVLGVFLGILFDLFYVPVSICRRIRFFVFLLDFIYCLTCCILFIIVIYITNYGYVRWYEFLSVALGMGIYRVVFDWHIAKLLLYISEKLYGIGIAALTFCLLPFKFVFKLIISIIQKNIELMFAFICNSILCGKCRRLRKKLLRDSENGFMDG